MAMTKLDVNLTPKERFEFYLDHQNKDVQWFQSKLKCSARTIHRWRSKAKKLTQSGKKFDTIGIEVIEAIEAKAEIPDNITDDYIEQSILHSKSREDLDRVRLMIDFLFKRAKFDKKQVKKKSIDIGAFLNESIK